MYYSESEDILKIVKESGKVFVNCHLDPDSDSIGSALFMRDMLVSLGKEVEIISPTVIDSRYHFLESWDDIKIVDFEKYDFGQDNLLILLDTGHWSRVFKVPNYQIPKISTVVIDNHKTNNGFGDLNLLDKNTSSVCEMLYHIASDWKFPIQKKHANYLLSGMVGDTGSFQYEIHKDTLKIASELEGNGVSLYEISLNLFNTLPSEVFLFLGSMTANLQIEKDFNFAYAAVPFAECSKYKDVHLCREFAVSILKKMGNIDFCFVLTEDRLREHNVSIRSRIESFDVSRIAKELNGGGHAGAAGIHIFDQSFEEVLNNLINVSKKFSNAHK